MKLRNNHRCLIHTLNNIIWIGVMALLASPASATEINLSNGVKGIWLQPGEKEDSTFCWKAQWIWSDDDNRTEVILARRNFTLDDIPGKAVLRISASESYQLYLNGQYVARGPARSAPHHQSYDIFDIKDILKPGENTIAVRVNYQYGKFSYQNVGRAGLMTQLNMENNGLQSIVFSDAGWKVLPDPSWNNGSPKIARFHLVVNDRVDMNKAIVGWTKIDFDDSTWPSALPLRRKEGWPIPQKDAVPTILTPPWITLVPRDIPYLEESDVKTTKLCEAFLHKTDKPEFIAAKETNPISTIPISGRIDKRLEEGAKCFSEKANPLIIPAVEKNESWILLFDFGEVINGFPQLNIQGPKGTIVDVMCAPYIVGNTFSYKIVDSEYWDMISLSGKKDKWQATCFKPVRYMALAIRGNADDVKLFSAGLHQLGYPFKESGHIHVPGATWVEDLWKASAKTIRVCTTDAYTDNYRERRQYAQTGYYASLGNYYIFGDNALQRRYLVQVAQEQYANGIMPAYAPLASDDYMVILDSNCLWIRGLHNYLLYSGDYSTVKELIPAATKLMHLLHSFTNKLGLIDNPPYPYWLDHALNDRRGANFNLNGHYLGALDDFSQVLSWLGNPDTALYNQRANLLRRSLRAYFWDDEAQLFVDAFVDGKRSALFSEHANAMALATNVASPEQAQLVAKQLLLNDKHNFIKRASGMTMVTPAMSYFLCKGLCMAGYVDEALEMLNRRFRKMLASGTNGTLWEEWWLDGTGRTGKLQKGKTRSDAQTESAFAPALFAEYLFGFKPLEPGMKKVKLILPDTKQKHLEAVIPSPEGNLTLKWDVGPIKKSTLNVDIPGKMILELDISRMRKKGIKIIKLNGNKVSLDQTNKSYISLSGGRYKIQF